MVTKNKVVTKGTQTAGAMHSAVLPLGPDKLGSIRPDPHEVNAAKFYSGMGSDSCKPSNPKDLIGSNKLPLHLFPATAIAYGSIALLDGAMKYGRSNYRAIGVKASVYKDACDRHMQAWFEGQGEAEDSGISHLAHAIACIAILIEATEQQNMVDDRNHKGAAYLNMIDRLTPEVARIRAKYADGPAVHHYTIDDN